MLSDNVYLDLADYIYFSKNKSLEGLNNKLNELGLEFRKNKGIKDINKAIEKARNPKNGHYRTEMEVDYLALCLKIDIVKQKSKYKVGDKVKIVDYPPEGSGFEICNNSLESEMGQWLGKVMTIKQVQDRCYIMKEDKGCWAWTPMLIEKRVN